MSVTRTRLSDLIVIKNGKDHQALSQGPYPVYGSGGVMRYVSEYLYDGEAVLLPRKGTLSNIQYAKGKFWTVDTTYYAIVNKNKADTYFLYHLLNHLDLSGLDSGASIPSMTARTYYSIKIDLPDLTTQKRIANILSTYDSLIEANNRRIELLEQTAQELYKEWFIRFRFPGHEKTKFENGLPEGWKIKRMNEFCYVTDGTHDTPKPVDVGVPLVTGRCISSGFVDFDAAYNISEADHKGIKKRSGLKSGDILFSNIGTVGNCCIVDYDREFSVKNVIIFKPETMRDTAYLYYWMTSSTMQEIFGAQTNGASQQFVGLTFMRRYKLLVPKDDILEAFADKVLPIMEQKRLLHQKNLNLATQRDMLLPRLMSGKLEV